ncbi:hypothetical protein HDU85_005917 [Gaertneriomyces sp. JEL0708]|nr:hypothetical protein HDU85_005917 [Gaertneriomyces sp. JEL0708]
MVDVSSSDMKHNVVPLTSFVLTDDQRNRIIRGNRILGNGGAISRYGNVLYSIMHADHDELSDLVKGFMTLYMQQDHSGYGESEKEALSNMYCECEAYEPDESDVWNTEFKVNAANKDNVRSMVCDVLTTLERYA